MSCLFINNVLLTKGNYTRAKSSDVNYLQAVIKPNAD